MNRAETRECTKSTIGTGDDPFFADYLTEAFDPLGDQLWVFHIVGRGIQCTGDQDFVIGNVGCRPVSSTRADGADWRPQTESPGAWRRAQYQ